MKKVLFYCLFILFVGELSAQNLIGLPKNQVTEIMKKNYSGFALDNSTINNTYKYLKYVDKFNDQTMLIFLSDKDISTSTKLMSDYSNLEEVKTGLNKTCKPSGKNKWVYTDKGITYLVTLKKEEWYFTVFTSKKEK